MTQMKSIRNSGSRPVDKLKRTVRLEKNWERDGLIWHTLATRHEAPLAESASTYITALPSPLACAPCHPFPPHVRTRCRRVQGAHRDRRRPVAQLPPAWHSTHGRTMKTVR